MKMAIWVSKVINSGKYSIAKFGAAGKEMQQVENLSITENELVPVYESEREASVVKGTKIGHSAYSAVFMDGMYEDGQRHDCSIGRRGRKGIYSTSRQRGYCGGC